MSLTNYHAGIAAEASVQRSYERSGFTCLHQRWRGSAGEIDLIFGAENTIVFVEVKKARSHEAAAARISPRQVNRILQTAEEFLAAYPEHALCELRCDAALVDAHGMVRIEEGAISH